MRLVRPAMAASTISGADTAKSGAMMFADAKGIDPELIGENRLLDDVADDLRVLKQAPSGPMVTSPNVSRPNSRCCAMGLSQGGHELGSGAGRRCRALI